jgi:hypothetical protein
MSRQRLIEKLESSQSLIDSEIGWLFWPETSSGAYTATNLRDIANELDHRNALSAIQNVVAPSLPDLVDRWKQDMTKCPPNTSGHESVVSAENPPVTDVTTRDESAP